MKRMRLPVMAVLVVWTASVLSAAVAWHDNLSNVSIPDQPVQGRLYGRAFALDQATLGGNILELRQGEDFFPDLAVKIFLFDEAAGLPGRTFNFETPAELGGPHIHTQWRKPGENVPETDILMEGYTLRLEFGQASNGRIPVGIYLCLPDEQRSVIAGHCTATLKDRPEGGSLTLIPDPTAQQGAPTTPPFGPGGLPPIDFSQVSPVALIACGLGILAMTIGGIWFIVVAFMESLVWGLLVLFIPFAQVFFLFMHLGRAWKPFLLGVLGLGLFLGGGMSLVTGASAGMATAMEDMQPMIEQKIKAARAAPQVSAPEPAPSESTSTPIALGTPLADVIRELGVPKARLEQGNYVILSYPEFTLVSEDGRSVTSIEQPE